MTKFLIEVPHETEKVACALAVRILLTTGSHFLTHADFGCLDGEHKARITVEGESKEEVRSILPPTYRSQAKIVKLNKFTLEGIEELRRQHDD